MLRLLGLVEPHGYDTRYRFEYVPQERFASTGWAEATSTPERDAGPSEFKGGQFPVEIVGESVPGLEAGVSYEYRIMATSLQGVAAGLPQQLTAPTAGPAEEARCPNVALRSGPSAALPDCRAYEQVTPESKGGTGDNWAYSGNLSTGALVGEDGEHVLVSAPASKWGTSPDPTDGTYFFSRSGDGWQMTSTTPEGGIAGDSYVPTIFSPDLTSVGVSVGWITTEHNSAKQLEQMLGAPGGPYAPVATVERGSEGGWVAASPSFGNVILSTADHTLLGKPTGTTNGKDLYEYIEGQLRQLNVDDAGEKIGICGAAMPSHIHGGVPGAAVSANGSRVLFEEVPGSECSGQTNLYMRIHGTETVDIGAYTLLAADAEDTRLLLESTSGEQIFLYEPGMSTAELLPGARPGPVSEDLSTIYFTTPEQLTPEAPPPAPESEDASPLGSAADLYRYDVASRQIHFALQGGSCLEVSPNGHDCYIESAGVPAVFRGSEPQGATEDPQVYRYDSVEDVVQCMSCASAFKPMPQRFALYTAGDDTFVERADAVPQITIASANGDYVFFDTAAALVPQDTDGEILACPGNCTPEDTEGNHNVNFSASMYMSGARTG